MKTTKQYVKEFGFDKPSDNYDRVKFLEWLGEDFEQFLKTFFNLNREITVKDFNTCIKQIKQKWDSINNKKAGNELSRELWNAFYATYIIVKKKELFPEHMAKLEAKQKALDVTVQQARIWAAQQEYQDWD